MSGTRKQKLELTWIGKEYRPKLEPRILLEEPEKSYHAPQRITDHDIFDNRLIFGDNLLALKALEQEFTGRIKSIFIDPPYNTGAAFDHYDDGVEHSLWLSLMRERLEILNRLLSPQGSLWITIDDNEVHYLKVLCDEVIGRKQFVANMVWQKRTSRENRAAIGSAHDHILLYAKSGPLEWKNSRNLLPANEAGYSNPDNDPRGAWRSIPFSAQGYRKNQMYKIKTPSGIEVEPPKGRCWSATEPEFLKLLAEPFGTPKPEKLLQQIIQIATNPGDWVLDSFAGSGTTGAVAHKMGRRWIMVELGEHCHTHIIPRLKKVIDGTDQSGISQAVGWGCGGGFRYFRLAPSLLEKDKWGNWVINKTYKPEMLTEAVCKLEGFVYAPSDTVYWQHGYSTERDFIYVTTQHLSHNRLQQLSDDVGEHRSLLVMCSAFRAKADRHPNLTVKKIPQTVLSRCEWGHDDYSLRVENLPKAPPKPGQLELALLSEGDR